MSTNFNKTLGDMFFYKNIGSFEKGFILITQDSFHKTYNVHYAILDYHTVRSLLQHRDYSKMDSKDIDNITKGFFEPRPFFRIVFKNHSDLSDYVIEDVTHKHYPFINPITIQHLCEDEKVDRNIAIIPCSWWDFITLTSGNYRFLKDRIINDNIETLKNAIYHSLYTICSENFYSKYIDEFRNMLQSEEYKDADYVILPNLNYIERLNHTNIASLRNSALSLYEMLGYLTFLSVNNLERVFENILLHNHSEKPYDWKDPYLVYNYKNDKSLLFHSCNFKQHYLINEHKTFDDVIKENKDAKVKVFDFKLFHEYIVERIKRDEAYPQSPC